LNRSSPAVQSADPDGIKLQGDISTPTHKGIFYQLLFFYPFRLNTNDIEAIAWRLTFALRRFPDSSTPIVIIYKWNTLHRFIS
jgi:hypothetical protein